MSVIVSQNPRRRLKNELYFMCNNIKQWNSHRTRECCGVTAWIITQTINWLLKLLAINFLSIHSAINWLIASAIIHTFTHVFPCKWSPRMIHKAENRGWCHLVAVVGNKLQQTEGIGGCAHLQIELPGKPTPLVHYVWQEQDERTIIHHSQAVSATFIDSDLENIKPLRAGFIDVD